MAEPAIHGPEAAFMLGLRADLGDPGVAEALGAALGLHVPAIRHATKARDGAEALWMSPDELLLLVPDPSAAAAALSAALGDRHHLLADQSGARLRFRVEGPGARDVLAKGMPVDLAPVAFGPGELRRSRLGQIAVLLRCTGPEAFELWCFRSLAPHLRLWLDTAAAPGRAVGFHD